MKIVLFEDSHVSMLDPVTTGRPAFAINCGSFRLIDLITANFAGHLSVVVRDHLVDVCTNLDFEAISDSTSTAHSDSANRETTESGKPTTLFVNGRLAPSVSNIERLKQLIDQPAPAMVVDGQSVLAATLNTPVVSSLQVDEFTAENFQRFGCHAIELPFQVINALHDLIQFNEASMAENLQVRIASGHYHEIADGVFSANGQNLPSHPIVTDSSRGPIVMESNQTIGPFAVLRGPIYLGANCKISEHASIRPFVSAGITCKLGGEIGSSIFESYSNKQHLGYLGNSWLGSWVNLGAGTCNSNLKNTYGTVNMQQGDRKISTGMQFVGCFIGDYSKTAINTSIYTGKTVGVCSMVYGMAVNDVAPFTNDAQMFGKVTEIDPKVMITTQGRMFVRRDVPQRDCDKELIRSMFQLTAGRRNGLSNEPISW